MKFNIGNPFAGAWASIAGWVDNAGDSITEFLTGCLKSAGGHIAIFVIELVACVVIGYSIYCACHIMCTTDDDKFTEYSNKTLIACICYFAARYGYAYLSHFLGA